MNIVVCIKQVPDTESKIKVKPDGSGIATEDIKYVMNPYDEFAVEEALKIKEKAAGSTVTIVSMGPKRAMEAIRTALAMGADKGVHLDDPAFEDSDSLTTAKALAAALKDVPHDLILCGKQAVDNDCSQVVQALAEVLNLPHATIVTKLEVGDGGVVASREIEGGAVEVLELPLPCVIGAQKGLNEPRYASLPGIMKAKKKEVKPVAVADLGMSAGDVGKDGSKIKMENFTLPPEREAGKKFEGEVEEIVPQVVKLLREEAKAI